jgi:hypothetical protein
VTVVDLAGVLAAIDEATAPACAVCTRPLNGSPSDDFCSELCQVAWTRGRADAAAVADLDVEQAMADVVLFGAAFRDEAGQRVDPTDVFGDSHGRFTDQRGQRVRRVDPQPAPHVQPMASLLEMAARIAQVAQRSPWPAQIRCGPAAWEELLTATPADVPHTIAHPSGVVTCMGVPVHIRTDLDPAELRLVDRDGRTIGRYFTRDGHWYSVAPGLDRVELPVPPRIASSPASGGYLTPDIVRRAWHITGV